MSGLWTELFSGCEMRDDVFVQNGLHSKLLVMPAEYAVSELAGVEAKRTEHEIDENECAIRVPLNAPRASLVTALDVFAQITGRSIRLLCKCFIRHGNILLESIAGVCQSAKQHDEILSLSGTHKNLSDIADDFKSNRYNFVGKESGRSRIDFHAARWAIGDLSRLCSGLWIPSGAAAAISIMLSISTTEREEMAGAAQDLMPEIQNFLAYVQESSFHIEALHKQALSRIGQEASSSIWKPSAGICWGKEPGAYHKTLLNKIREMNKEETQKATQKK